MPLLRGAIHELIDIPGASPGSRGLAVLTNNRWNAVMTAIGGAVVRPEILPFETSYSVRLRDGRFATAARVISVRAPDAAPPGDPSPIGPSQGSLTDEELDALEDGLVCFLQIPMLLSASPATRRSLGDATTYPVWGELYRGREPIAGERKRFLVVSPNEWNQATQIASVVRTTAQTKADAAQFPPLHGGRARACCGDLSTFGPSELLMARRERPVPATCTLQEMTAVVRGIIVTHDLAGAARRAAT